MQKHSWAEFRVQFCTFYPILCFNLTPKCSYGKLRSFHGDHAVARKNESPKFETSLAELEEIVSKMEQGDLSLEDSLDAFEKGVKLSNDCQKALKSAEQKVNKLVAKGDGLVIESFDPEQNDR